MFFPEAGLILVEINFFFFFIGNVDVVGLATLSKH